jgi:hypothetical protein
MGLFDSLFKSNTKGIFKTANEANQTLSGGMDQAKGYLTGGASGAKDALGTGYKTASGVYGQYGQDAFGDLAGGYAGANKQLTTGYAGAEDAVNKALGTAQGYYDPFYKSGVGANSLYDQALGVGGAGAAKDFYANYAANDPFRAFRDDMAQKELERRYNATGGFTGGGAGGGSGRFASASARASLERGSQDLNAYLDRLERAAGRGTQVAGAMSGNAMAAGNTTAGLRTGLADRMSANEVGYGKDLANTRMGLADRQAGLATDYGKGMAGVDAASGSALANLIYGNAQQTAANNINAENAATRARARPGQNLLGLGGLALGAGFGGGMGSGLMSLFNKPSPFLTQNQQQSMNGYF